MDVPNHSPTHKSRSDSVSLEVYIHLFIVVLVRGLALFDLSKICVICVQEPVTSLNLCSDPCVL